ncbi:hypothetical protein RIVM261_073370 [Rivularia sp. IAM M-261]|nr:hypothetical protein RIVM261_073370 [Rivularia sp. IAM M-261]
MHLKLEECKATRVILVRHGQSTYNSLGLYQGCSDESVLTELGYSDARKTGNFLKGLKFDAMYTSSLQRAQQTAKEILGVMAPSLNFESICASELLRETDLPAWQGKAFQYVKENFPQEYRTWKQFPHEFRMEIPNQNTYIHPALDLYDRVHKFWRQVLPRHVGETILLVVHGGTNRALISTALGITPDRYHCIQQSNCGISVLNFPDGTLESGRLEIMNLASHVGEYLPKPQEGGKGLRLLLISSGASAEQINSLAEQLNSVKIRFCLSSIVDDSHTIVQKVIQHHSETVYSEVFEDELPEVWQTGIINQITANTNSLVTGLIVAKEQIIKNLIGQALGMDLKQVERLQVEKGTICSIQYPGEHHPPIVQGMNLGDVYEAGRDARSTRQDKTREELFQFLINE